MRRITSAVAAAVMALGLAGPAFAVDFVDATPDGPRCDTWYREGHDPNHNGHSHDHTANTGTDQDHGAVYVHDHTGHYVVRTQYGYVEVVGGGYFDGSGGTGNLNQGGFVQFEIDPGLGLPIPVDADGHVNLFASAKHGECITIGDTKVGNEGDDPQH